MAEASRRISGWLYIVVLLSTALSDPGQARAEDPPKGSRSRCCGGIIGVSDIFTEKCADTNCPF